MILKSEITIEKFLNNKTCRKLPWLTDKAYGKMKDKFHQKNPYQYNYSKGHTFWNENLFYICDDFSFSKLSLNAIGYRIRE